MNRDLLRRDIGAPLHHQVFSVLRSGIVSGRYPEGSYLPAEDVLTRDFGVSRATVRRAMQSLEAENLIVRRQGLGTRVIYPGSDRLAVSNHLRLFGDPSESSEVAVLEFGEVVPIASIARDLGLEDGQHAIRIVRLRSLDRVPMRILTNHAPPDVGAKLSAEELRQHTMLAALQLHDFAVYRVEDEYGAVLADRESAIRLDVQIGAPLIEGKRIFFDEARRPICHQTTLMPPDRTRFRQVIEADGDKPLANLGASTLFTPRKGGIRRVD